MLGGLWSMWVVWRFLVKNQCRYHNTKYEYYSNTFNFHIIFNVDSVALIYLDVANCSQASWKIDMFDARHQSTVFLNDILECTWWNYWNVSNTNDLLILRERERERERACRCKLRRVFWRYRLGNQKPYFKEEEQPTQWPED